MRSQRREKEDEEIDERKFTMMMLICPMIVAIFYKVMRRSYLIVIDSFILVSISKGWTLRICISTLTPCWYPPVGDLWCISFVLNSSASEIIVLFLPRTVAVGATFTVVRAATRCCLWTSYIFYKQTYSYYSKYLWMKEKKEENWKQKFK